MRDLGIGFEHLGDVHERGGQGAEAIAAFDRALAIYRQLATRNPDDLQSRLFAVAPLWRLATLEGRGGRPRLEQALAILEPLAAARRLDATRLGWIGRIRAQLSAGAN